MDHQTLLGWFSGCIEYPVLYGYFLTTQVDIGAMGEPLLIETKHSQKGK